MRSQNEEGRMKKAIAIVITMVMAGVIASQSIALHHYHEQEVINELLIDKLRQHVMAGINSHAEGGVHRQSPIVNAAGAR